MGLEILKTRFQDNSYTKRFTQWAKILVGFGGSKSLGHARWPTAVPIFSPKVARTIKVLKNMTALISHYKSIDDNLADWKNTDNPLILTHGIQAPVKNQLN